MQAAAATLPEERDAELLTAVAHGDRQAFDELYASYRGRLLRFVMRVAPGQEIADEVVNDTFWIVWQRASQFRGASRVSTWIMGIAHRCALKALRRARSGLPGAGALSVAHDVAVSVPQEEAERRDWIHQALRLLPDEQRASIELAYYHGHSCEEIARIMHCGVPAVKARMFHARRKLRAALPLLAERTRISIDRPERWLALVLACLVAGTWGDRLAVDSAGPYRTVSSVAPQAHGSAIHAVFLEPLDPHELHALLGRARVRIVAGPTAAGVYSLAPLAGSRPEEVKAAVNALRQEPRVRFAESLAGSSRE